jgi:hypothetical protein
MLAHRGVGEVHRLVPAVLADMVNGEVHDNAIEPGKKRRRSLKPVQVSMSLDESVLHHVHGVVLAAQDPVSKSIGTTLIPLEEHPERLAITALRRRNQLSIVWCAMVRRERRHVRALIHSADVITPLPIKRWEPARHRVSPSIEATRSPSSASSSASMRA